MATKKFDASAEIAAYQAEMNDRMCDDKDAWEATCNIIGGFIEKLPKAQQKAFQKYLAEERQELQDMLGELEG